MKIVYRAENVIDANLVKGLLEQAGIQAFVNGSYLGGGMGELPVRDLITVGVADSDVGAARQIVDEYQAKVSITENDETRWDNLSDGLLDWSES